MRLAASSLVAVIWACAPAVMTRPEPVAPARPENNPWAESVRSLLVPQCGRCHLPNLATSQPKALAVFNFMDEPWYQRMRPEQFEALAQRVRGNSAFPDSEKPTVEAFVRCATGGSCAEAPSSGG
jgi:hypothetical protein